MSTPTTLLQQLITLRVLTHKEKLMIQFLRERLNLSTENILETQDEVSLFLTLLCYENSQGRVRMEWNSHSLQRMTLALQEEYQAHRNPETLDFTLADLEAHLKAASELDEQDIRTKLSLCLEEKQLDFGKNLQLSHSSRLLTHIQQGQRSFYYFQKNYHAEIEILEGVQTLLNKPQVEGEVQGLQALQEVFSEPYILPKDDKTGEHFLFHERQVLAAYLASQSPFFIISGGPGTGKTSVLVQVLRTLMRTQVDLNVEEIALCAPTGRAKARMGESLVNSLAPLKEYSLGHPGVQRPDIEKDLSLTQCQENSFTLHSLLRRQLNGSQEKLNYKLIVIDEFSMVDVHLFALLIRSLPEGCRLILLGDMHQLPPVGHGSVLGDLSKSFTQSKATLSESLYQKLQGDLQNLKMDQSSQGYEITTTQSHKLLNKIVVLTKSQRSAEHILKIAQAANDGNVTSSKHLLQTSSETQGQVQYLDSTLNTIQSSAKEFLSKHLSPQWKQSLQKLENQVQEELPPLVTASQQEALHSLFTEIFQSHHNMRILCLGHQGPRGTLALNQLARQLLNPLVKDPTKRLHGELVMVTRNQNDIGLYNGDAGICFIFNHARYVVFPVESSFRVEPLERIHYIESAFAISVHKSQGSEYREILLALPERKNKLLNREILYTGLTRAKKVAKVFGEASLFAEGVKRYVDRPSALSEWLEK